MINEERLKLMIKLAAFESKSGKEALKTSKYFRKDYVGYQMLKTGIAVTVAYLILIGLWFVYHMDFIIDHIYQFDYKKFAQQLIIPYVILMVLYLIISYILYSYRYTKSVKKLKLYSKDLRKLERLTSDLEKKRRMKQSKVGGEQDD
ncbi:MAG TPA: hypothetical protein IAC41_05660 [Candidatus Merdenecus merdavium]|nr:hypothetical protein [Candidatus Merdenecus merdavium]